jgi:ferrous iron transport protein B
MNKIALVGKPNSGKSSLFNLLTGLNQKVGNYSGVTVEKKSGYLNKIEITDLPGLNSLWADTAEEQISQSYILNLIHDETPAVLVCNANHLRDNLVLFSEVADLQIPMILVINFMDELKNSNSSIDIKALEARLGCPVCLMNSKKGTGLDTIKQLIQSNGFKVPNSFCRSSYDVFSQDVLTNKYVSNLLTNEQELTEDKLAMIEKDFAQREMLVSKILSGGILIYDEINDKLRKRTSQLDKILLHPFWGIIIFLAIMFLVFQAVFSFSTYPMDWIDQLFAWLSGLVNEKIQSSWFSDLISDGILPGLAGVMIFIPQIAILFFLLGILENTGYLSRISNISDAFLQSFGLSGKSVIPLMSSWACAIPAIMSTRTIDDQRERLSVIFAAPLMTCSARLPVYTILIAVLVPEEDIGVFGLRGLILLMLYLLGLASTLIIAYIVSRKSQYKSTGLWTLEMPNYRSPNWRNVFYNMYLKTRSFVVEAGKVIFTISIVLWFLATNSPKNEAFFQTKYQEYQQLSSNTDISMDAVRLEYSYAGYLGKIVEPAIKPLGYDWKIGIALISSFAAREVFVGTLSTIYSVGSEDEQPVIERLKKEVNIKTGLPRYDTATNVSLLLFYVFALQCMSTLAVVRKETGHWKFAFMQFFVFTLIAYVFAFAAYQIIK